MDIRFDLVTELIDDPQTSLLLIVPTLRTSTSAPPPTTPSVGRGHSTMNPTHLLLFFAIISRLPNRSFLFLPPVRQQLPKLQGNLISPLHPNRLQYKKNGLRNQSVQSHRLKLRLAESLEKSGHSTRWTRGIVFRQSHNCRRSYGRGGRGL